MTDVTMSLAPDVEQLRSGLIRLAIAQGGWADLLTALSTETGRFTRLVGTFGNVFAESEHTGGPAPARPVGDPAEADHDGGLDPAVVAAVLAEGEVVTVTCRDGLRGAAHPVVAGERRIGLLVMEGPASPATTLQLQAATVALAIESAHRDAKAMVRASRGGGFISSLRSGGTVDEDGLARIAAYWDLELTGPYAGVVFTCDRPGGRAWRVAASWIENPVLIGADRAWTVLTGDAETVGRDLDRIRRRLDGIVGPGTVRAAAGPIVSGTGAACATFDQADLLVDQLASTGEARSWSYDALGATALLLSVPRTEQLAFAAAQLGEAADRPELVETLRAWVAARCRRDDAAAALGLHRNSVSHRMARARDLLPDGSLEPGIAPDLVAALLVLDLERVPVGS